MRLVGCGVGHVHYVQTMTTRSRVLATDCQRKPITDSNSSNGMSGDIYNNMKSPCQ
ncbi:hypothetical protein [Nostoc sp. DedQUE09]|uniref:hypothetical protein n=1 Tax=Nostoc sp. DedQUE09 TaxID=3075394 RepID=UPI002AD310C6|nr:hypothetical protein [Nostoc sp. DedQUE09]MDZ7955330.1 hypothetical protein [Nostoc sp. DedQUE09]